MKNYCILIFDICLDFLKIVANFPNGLFMYTKKKNIFKTFSQVNKIQVLYFKPLNMY